MEFRELITRNLFLLIIFVTIMQASSTTDTYRFIHAQSVRSKDVYLPVPPIREEISNPIACLRACSTEPKCLSINYHVNKTCQLLDTYYCSIRNISLVHEPGFTYFDVDYNQPADAFYRRRISDECVQNDRCSPKCKGCTVRAAFTILKHGRIDSQEGVIDTFTDKDINECKVDCSYKKDPECRAVLYNMDTLLCTYLALTVDMYNPSVFISNPSIKYLQRGCY